MIVVSWLQFLQQAALLISWILICAAIYHFAELLLGDRLSHQPEEPKRLDAP
jgi:hypothetical protein